MHPSLAGGSFTTSATWEALHLYICLTFITLYIYTYAYTLYLKNCSSVAKSDSLRPHGLQHTSFPCPSVSAGVNSCSLCQWCHPTISSSVAPFSCLQSFPASGSFLMSRPFASGGQRIRASATVLPVNIQGWFPLWLTVLISLQFKGLSGV